MVALARKTLIYEWRRFLPAILAVGFAGLLQLLQAALVLGIFGSASIYITGSTGDLWAGYPGTQSVSLGQPIDRSVAMRLYMDPDVTRVEPFDWVDGNWRGPRGGGGVSVFVCGIDANADGMMFARKLTPAMRELLKQPDSIIVDEADLGTLGIRLGETARINGQRVHVVGISHGLRALGGVNVVTSLDTARKLDDDPEDLHRMTFYLAKLRDPAQASAVAKRLRGSASFGPYTVWTARDFARRSQLYWILDTGAGVGVLFLAGIVFLVGAVITSQTLIAAVIGSIQQYATLNALGVGVWPLRRVVMEQAFWVGLIGLAGSVLLGGILLALGQSNNVPVSLDPLTALACLALGMGLAIVSGLAAMRSLNRADPASLLR
ncbi:ABC transporter permease [Dyella sp. A6]|uniref:ABC transporter permease n=1 Tax=Dyella aluminiiresistens TaxID=3069105 RepID=UPI002E77B4A4|nr:ABC transporter permease [Dyella sp. A6]